MHGRSTKQVTMTLKSPSPSLAVEPVLSLPDGLRPLANDQECFREFVRGEIVVGSGKRDERIRFIVSGEFSSRASRR